MGVKRALDCVSPDLNERKFLKTGTSTFPSRSPGDPSSREGRILLVFSISGIEDEVS